MLMYRFGSSDYFSFFLDLIISPSYSSTLLRIPLDRLVSPR